MADVSREKSGVRQGLEALLLEGDGPLDFGATHSIIGFVPGCRLLDGCYNVSIYLGLQLIRE